MAMRRGPLMFALRDAGETARAHVGAITDWLKNVSDLLIEHRYPLDLVNGTEARRGFTALDWDIARRRVLDGDLDSLMVSVRRPGHTDIPLQATCRGPGVPPSSGAVAEVVLFGRLGNLRQDTPPEGIRKRLLAMLLGGLALAWLGLQVLEILAIVVLASCSETMAMELPSP